MPSRCCGTQLSALREYLKSEVFRQALRTNCLAHFHEDSSSVSSRKLLSANEPSQFVGFSAR